MRRRYLGNKSYGLGNRCTVIDIELEDHRPWLCGAICGIMTRLGGLGHTLPYLVPGNWSNAFWIATSLAGVVVFFELWAIAYIRTLYMDTPFLQAAFQVVLGGAIVLGVGILIGAS
jgi:erythrin-vacuolar iron transport family protein